MECQSCGGKLKKKGKHTYQCASCDSSYYIPMSFFRRFTLNLSITKVVVAAAVLFMAIAAVGIGVYQVYTAGLVKDASRFSVIIREFLLEAYGKPVADISKEDLAGMKYLKILKEEGDYRFYYSFEDYSDFEDEAEFEKTQRSIWVEDETWWEDFFPEDIRYFTGLTKLELYSNAWQDFTLPKENVVRSITCVDGLSRYGDEPVFFQNINTDTLEEVIMLTEDKLENFDFLEDIGCVKCLYLQKPVIIEATMFDKLDSLEELYLEMPDIEEAKAYEMVEGMLQCPNLKKLTIEGRAGWYISDEEWEQLQRQYGDRVLLERW